MGELEHAFLSVIHTVHHPPSSPLLSSPTPGGSSIHNSRNKIGRVLYPTVLSTEYGIFKTLSTYISSKYSPRFAIFSDAI